MKKPYLTLVAAEFVLYVSEDDFSTPFSDSRLDNLLATIQQAHVKWLNWRGRKNIYLTKNRRLPAGISKPAARRNSTFPNLASQNQRLVELYGSQNGISKPARRQIIIHQKSSTTSRFEEHIAQRITRKWNLLNTLPLHSWLRVSSLLQNLPFVLKEKAEQQFSKSEEKKQDIEKLH